MRERDKEEMRKKECGETATQHDCNNHSRLTSTNDPLAKWKVPRSWFRWAGSGRGGVAVRVREER